MSSFDESTTVFESFPSDDISSRSNTESQTNTVFARLTARAELNVPTLNTKSMIAPNDVSSNSNMYIRSPYFTIPPGLSPITLLESPVFLSSPMAQQSPTTGKFQFAPGNDTNSNLNSESIDSTFFSFRPVIDSSHTAFFGASSKAVHESSIFSSRTEKEHPKVLHSQSEASPYLPTDINRGNKVKVVDISGGSVMSLHPLDVEVSDQMGGGDATHVDTSEDGYNWRKYGQKQVKGSNYPRSYYRCTHPSCTVKKKVERSYEGHITEIIYKGAHNHSKPHPNKGLAFGLVDPRSGNNVQTWVTSDGSSGFSNDDDEDVSDSKIRKIEEYVSETSRATRSIKRPKVVVQTTSQVDILDDGYHWRKYGQKVVKGNPNPRGYYKCTSPGCIVRKHVERASHDLNSVITMYEGKHNHNVPAARNTGYSNLDSSDNKVVQIGNTAHLQKPEQSQVQNVFGSNMPTDMSSLGFDYGVNKAGLASLVMARLDQEYDDPIQPQFGQVSEMGSVLPKGEPNLEYLSESCSMNIPTSSSVYSDVRRNYD